MGFELKDIGRFIYLQIKLKIWQFFSWIFDNKSKGVVYDLLDSVWKRT